MGERLLGQFLACKRSIWTAQRYGGTVNRTEGRGEVVEEALDDIGVPVDG